MKTATLVLKDMINKHTSEISLSGEDNPSTIREYLSKLLQENDSVEIDMQAIKSLSPSFAYEAVGKLYGVFGEQVKNKLTFKNDVLNLKDRIIKALERYQKIQIK